jgi:Holliday junction resolvase RusA-like endonuclease
VATFRLDLPLPPTANHAYPTNWRTRRRFLSPKAKAWKTEAGWMIRAANPPRISGPYTFRILIPAKARGDADGYVKLPQDLLSELGVTPNDRKSQDSRGSRDPSVKWRRCVVVVESVA